METVRDALRERNAAVFARLVQTLSLALLSGSYSCGIGLLEGPASENGTLCHGDGGPRAGRALSEGGSVGYALQLQCSGGLLP
jgi:hypothetical protein